MSIAYLLGKGSSRPLRYKPNIPLLLVLSIIPDVDIFFDYLTGSQLHRGPTHSVIVAIIAFIPFFIIYRKKAIPYFLALISHPLIGDFFIGGKLELLWPFSNAQFGLHELGGPYISIYMPIDGLIEVILFVFAMVLLVKSNDWKVFFTAHKSNLLLIIPLFTVLLPTTIGYPFSESLFLFSPILAVAHAILVVIFSIAVLKTLQSLYQKRKAPRKPGGIDLSGN
ncbi:MAG: metal-dependent hydrolase [Candidatus Bathyarchaeia archaeon]|jgi:hypothetical protein